MKNNLTKPFLRRFEINKYSIAVKMNNRGQLKPKNLENVELDNHKIHLKQKLKGKQGTQKVTCKNV